MKLHEGWTDVTLNKLNFTHVVCSSFFTFSLFPRFYRASIHSFKLNSSQEANFCPLRIALFESGNNNQTEPPLLVDNANILNRKPPRWTITNETWIFKSNSFHLPAKSGFDIWCIPLCLVKIPPFNHGANERLKVYFFIFH